MSSAKRPPSCLGLNESMSQWVNEAKNELMKPRLYLLWIHLCTFFSMFAIHMCEKICFFFPEILVRHYVLCVCTCTNQLVLSTEVTRLNFLNSIVMGQINQCGFQSHVAIDRYCIFLEINTFELSWVELNWVMSFTDKHQLELGHGCITTSTYFTLLKFGNGYVISSHTLLGM